MAKLDKKDILAPSSSRRPDRIEVLINAIKDGIPLELESGSKMMVFPLSSNKQQIIKLANLRNNPDSFSSIRLMGSDKHSYQINALKKTKMFGGGGGARGGADLTAITESGQAYVCSFVYNSGRKASQTDFSYEKLKPYAKYVNASISLDDVLEKTPIDWISSYIKVANKLFDDFKFPASKTIYAHRGSKFMNDIYKAKSDTLKKDKQSDNPQAPGSFDNNKWNPGDIWLSTLTSVPDLPTDSWSSLNQKIYELSSGSNRSLLSVSLKKVESSNAHLDEFNKPDEIKKRVSFGGFTISPERPTKGSIPFFSSIDMYMIIDGKKVQFRATSGNAQSPGWQGEIQGLSAAGGKIGGGNINFFLKEVYNETLFKDEGEIISKLNSTSFWQEFYGYYTELFPGGKFYSELNNKIGDTPVPFETFKQLALEKAKESQTYIPSKFINMKLLNIVIRGTSDQLNKFSSKMFLYALSNTDQSSYFVKVS